MDYLERNRVIIGELSSVGLTAGHEVGYSKTFEKKPKTTFVSIGSYDSACMGRRVYVGLKKSLVQNKSMSDRAPVELAIINRIHREFPHLADELPLFYGALFKTDECLGIVTEDFSEGGRYRVEDVFDTPFLAHPNQVPMELQRLFGEENDEYDLARMAFMVNGRRRLGDFDNIPKPLPFFKMIEFPKIYKSFGHQHVLRIDYDI